VCVFAVLCLISVLCQRSGRRSAICWRILSVADLVLGECPSLSCMCVLLSVRCRCFQLVAGAPPCMCVVDLAGDFAVSMSASFLLCRLL
jgi:hypothetical protein